MKYRPAQPPRHHGMTLLEMTVVIGVLLALMSTGLYFTNQTTGWKAAKDASETLRSVYAAQRMFLADNPTTAVSAIKEDQLLPYMSNKPVAMPTITSLEDKALTINITVSPPVVDDGSGGVYDPSGDSNDSLWDVGE